VKNRARSLIIIVVIVMVTMADRLQGVSEGPTRYAAPLPLSLFVGEPEVNAVKTQQDKCQDKL
jgi:hypothetical protein